MASKRKPAARGACARCSREHGLRDWREKYDRDYRELPPHRRFRITPYALTWAKKHLPPAEVQLVEEMQRKEAA